MSKRYYLAYGSNLNINQMRMRCPDSKVVSKGFINDYELLFKGSLTGAYLTIEEKKGGKVPVGIWEVSKLDELSLDRYEGYPTFYYKREFEIELNGKKEVASVYIMHEERELGIPTDYYVEVCKEGYEAYSFDKRYLTNAIKRSISSNNGRNIDAKM